MNMWMLKMSGLKSLGTRDISALVITEDEVSLAVGVIRVWRAYGESSLLCPQDVYVYL